MNSITRMAFAAAILGATTLWIAGRPVETDRGGQLNPAAAPVHVTEATRAAAGSSDGASEKNLQKEPDDSAPRLSMPLIFPISSD